MWVEFTAHGAVQGIGFRPGDRRELPESVGRVYCRVSQAKEIEPPAAADPEPASEDPEPPPGKKTVRRGAKTIETAAGGKAERR